MKNLNIQFDPFFVEEAVFLSMKTCGKEALMRDFHRERDELYNRNSSAEERNQLFKNFYEKYFEKTGLEECFGKVIVEFPLLLREDVLIFVKRVWTKREEEVELFSQDGQKTIYVGLQVIRVLDKNFLETFLRHELAHISDMLDPQFQYDPYISLGGKNELEDNLIRDRFRVLWDRDIHERLSTLRDTNVLTKGFLSSKSTHQELVRLACSSRINDLPALKEGVVSCLEA